MPGRIPKELANLSKLTGPYLHRNEDLQVLEGAPTDKDGDVYYTSREEVEAFQKCLK